ncbi:NAD-dependent epimerase/dehydratase family protein [Candidatus Dependentiae bacterium]|nr:NAD-dependent epimerase/dehydratase family protein [Candidatus Dependentiae bacterium]
MNKQLWIIICCITLTLGNMSAKTFLVFGGKTGWIGKKIVHILQNKGHEAVCAKSRLQNRADLEKKITQVKPDHIINAAGVTGRPNVDWCESNKQHVIRANLVGALTLFDVAYVHNIHVINFGTGCIYEYDAKHSMHSGIGFTENEEPNFQGSFYSFTKTMLDKLVTCYPNVLNLRLRMPISDDLHHRNFITKITKYARVVNIPNSMSVLHDLLPLVPIMAERQLTGNYNFVNPGVISHNQILDLYTQYIDPNFTYKNFTLEEQDKILKAGRSNNELDVNKLLSEFPQITHIQKSIIGVFKRMQKNFKIKINIAKR